MPRKPGSASKDLSPKTLASSPVRGSLRREKTEEDQLESEGWTRTCAQPPIASRAAKPVGRIRCIPPYYDAPKANDEMERNIVVDSRRLRSIPTPKTSNPREPYLHLPLVPLFGDAGDYPAEPNLAKHAKLDIVPLTRQPSPRPGAISRTIRSILSFS